MWTTEEEGYLRDLAVMEVVSGERILNQEVVKRFNERFGAGARPPREIERRMAGSRQLVARKAAEVDRTGLFIDEHRRVSEAAQKLIERIDPDYAGDLPAAMEAMAEGVHEGVQGMYDRLRKLSR